MPSTSKRQRYSQPPEQTPVYWRNSYAKKKAKQQAIKVQVDVHQNADLFLK
jgi:hypothetical protein